MKYRERAAFHETVIINMSLSSWTSHWNVFTLQHWFQYMDFQEVRTYDGFMKQPRIESCEDNEDYEIWKLERAWLPDSYLQVA